MNRFSTVPASSPLASRRSRPRPTRWWLGGTLLVLALAWGVWADNIGYPVKVTKGFGSTDAGRMSITRAKLVGTDHLVLVLDTTTHAIRLVEVDAQTNLVATLAESSQAAFLTNGQFAGLLVFSELVLPNLGDNLAPMAIIKGSTSTSVDASSNVTAKANATLIGVLNDSTSGLTNEPDRIFQLNLQPAGTGFDADPFGL